MLHKNLNEKGDEKYKPDLFLYMKSVRHLRKHENLHSKKPVSLSAKSSDKFQRR